MSHLFDLYYIPSSIQADKTIVFDSGATPTSDKTIVFASGASPAADQVINTEWHAELVLDRQMPGGWLVGLVNDSVATFQFIQTTTKDSVWLLDVEGAVEGEGFWYENFAAYPVNSDIDDAAAWSLLPTNAQDTTAVLDLNAAGDRLLCPPSDGTPYFLRWDNAGQLKNFNVLCKLKVQSTNNSGDYIGILAFRSTDFNNGYAVAIRDDDFSAHLLEITGTTKPVYSVLDSSAAAVVTDGGYFYYRVVTSGNKLRVRVWKTSDSEPSTWTLQANDNTYSSANYIGWIGPTR